MKKLPIEQLPATLLEQAKTEFTDEIMHSGKYDISRAQLPARMQGDGWHITLRRVQGNLHLLFLDMEITYLTVKDDKNLNETVHFHRLYSVDGSRIEKILTPYRDGLYWNASYAPEAGLYTDGVHRIYLKIGSGLDASVYIAIDKDGRLLDHMFNFGPESCD